MNMINFVVFIYNFGYLFAIVIGSK